MATMLISIFILTVAVAYFLWRKNRHDKHNLMVNLFNSAIEGSHRRAIDESLQRLGVTIDGSGYGAEAFCAHAAAAILTQHLVIKPHTDDELYAGGILIMVLVDVLSRRHNSNFELAAGFAPVVWADDYLDPIENPEDAGQFIASIIETYNSLVTKKPRLIESLGTYFSKMLDGTLSEENRHKLEGLHQVLCQYMR